MDDNWDRQNGTEVTFSPKAFDSAALQEYFWELYRKFYSFKSILTRVFTLDNLKGGESSILTPLKTNLYFRKRIKNRLHPIEN